jgi:hypothetical protein
MGVGAVGGDEFGGSGMILTRIELPYERTEYYYSEDKTTRWWISMLMFDSSFSHFLSLDGDPATFRAHHSYWNHWSEPPFSPQSPDASSWFATAVRSGDELYVGWPMYSDRAGHAISMPSDGRTALYANGKLVGESDYGEGGYFDVPSESAHYRMELSYSQSMFALTTREELVWTFESAHVEQGQTELLPLLTVHFSPLLNELGEAPRVPLFPLPLSVEQYGRSGPPVVKEPSVEVSYDDGATWARVAVEADGLRWNALLDHPLCGADYVSLRVRARDFAGNAVEQTLIRAYALAQHH